LVLVALEDALEVVRAVLQRPRHCHVQVVVGLLGREIALLEGLTVVYRSSIDLYFYVIGSPHENELMLTAVLGCLFDSLSQMLRYWGGQGGLLAGGVAAPQAWGTVAGQLLLGRLPGNHCQVGCRGLSPPGEPSASGLPRKLGGALRPAPPQRPAALHTDLFAHGPLCTWTPLAHVLHTCRLHVHPWHVRRAAHGPLCTRPALHAHPVAHTPPCTRVALGPLCTCPSLHTRVTHVHPCTRVAHGPLCTRASLHTRHTRALLTLVP
uniref:Coatomer subunit zeta n=1 Tax=Nothoprocta perdicaria TaxID=30464 RepID=A0A8C6ZS10_NOTPE